MAFYPKEFQALVNSKNRIIEVMEENGDQVFGNGKTRSFNCPMCGGDKSNAKVSVELNHFHCFRCENVRGEAFKGGPIQYLQQRMKISLPEAVERMAKRAGIALQARQAQPVDREKSNLYLEIVKYYERFSDRAVAYLVTRGLAEEQAELMVKRYRIGYAPGAISLKLHLLDKGYTPAQLNKYGLLGESGADKFFNRVVVPLFRRGNPYDFYTRRADGMNHMKHWPLEGKGMDFGAEFIPKFAPVVDIYESIVNKLLAEAQGFEHGIAIGGISNVKLEELIATLKRISPKVVRLVLDADRAGQGQNAALRFGEALQKAGFSVKIVMLPLGEDVGDLIAGGKAEVFHACMNNALDFLVYRAHLLMASFSEDIIKQHLEWRNHACSTSSTSAPSMPSLYSAIFFSSSAELQRSSSF